jgi:hypothetical protein
MNTTTTRALPRSGRSGVGWNWAGLAGGWLVRRRGAEAMAEIHKQLSNHRNFAAQGLPTVRA